MRTPGPNSITVTSSGDLGDIVSLMCVLHAQPGGPHTILLRDDGKTKGIVARKDVIMPLCLSQDYIADCRPWQHGDKVDWASEEFRMGGFHGPTVTLVDAHQNHGLHVGAVKQKADPKHAWIQIPYLYAGYETKVVINRTDRWRSPYFNWKAVLDTYGIHLLFIGTKHEHETFCQEVGHVDFKHTNNLLEVANIIRNCFLFMGNQSSCWAIAEGLKVRRIQETSPAQTDCVYEGGDVQHVIDGEMTLPALWRDPDPVMESVFVPSPCSDVCLNISTAMVPPDGGWKCPPLRAHQIFNRQMEAAQAHFGMSEWDARKHVIAETYKAHPSHFPPGERQDLRRRLEEARRK